MLCQRHVDADNLPSVVQPRARRHLDSKRADQPPRLVPWTYQLHPDTFTPMHQANEWTGVTIVTLAIAGFAMLFSAGSLIVGAIAVSQTRRYSQVARLKLEWRPYLYTDGVKGHAGEVLLVVRNSGLARANGVKIWFPKYGSSHGHPNVELISIEPGATEYVRVPVWKPTDRPLVEIDHAGLLKVQKSRGPRKLLSQDLSP